SPIKTFIEAVLSARCKSKIVFVCATSSTTHIWHFMMHYFTLFSFQGTLSQAYHGWYVLPGTVVAAEYHININNQLCQL
ncbi:hypothetical protein, partial [Sporomusa sp.]|uniref:hypothetical protein n=1 Tax=Sporomusa sp. TaxID=2078658 RepID=UPI002B5FECF1